LIRFGATSNLSAADNSPQLTVFQPEISCPPCRGAFYLKILHRLEPGRQLVPVLMAVEIRLIR
jgi:hypothetical protein